MVDMCDDCLISKATTHYGLGAMRCDACSETFDTVWRAKRKAIADAATCDECGIKTGGPDVCEEHCDHYDTDEGYCLDCGKDRTEELASLAYDRYKDFIKYGE